MGVIKHFFNYTRYNNLTPLIIYVILIILLQKHTLYSQEEIVKSVFLHHRFKVKIFKWQTITFEFLTILRNLS